MTIENRKDTSDRFNSGGYPATSAAEKFQSACHRDRYEDFVPAYNALRRIAVSKFPSRGDALDILDDTIHEYGLWGASKPQGFWTAFAHNMIDAKKALWNSNREYIDLDEQEPSERDSARITQTLLQERAAEFHGQSVWEKFEAARRSDRETDRQICLVIERMRTNECYMSELDKSESLPTNSRIAAELRCTIACSPAKAYRLLKEFRKTYSSAREV